jgi:hypothetical protein
VELKEVELEEVDWKKWTGGSGLKEVDLEEVDWIPLAEDRFSNGIL